MVYFVKKRAAAVLVVYVVSAYQHKVAFTGLEWEAKCLNNADNRLQLHWL